MTIGLALVTPPAAEPVSVSEAEDHLRLDAGAETALVTRLIAAARQAVEAATGRALITQAWALSLPVWPHPEDGGPPEIRLPKPPLVNVTAVEIETDTGAETLDTEDYAVDTATVPGRVLLLDPAAPHPKRGGTITLTYVAGYGPAAGDVPASLRQTILTLCGHAYAHRGDEGVDLPPLAARLTAPYRVAQL